MSRAELIAAEAAYDTALATLRAFRNSKDLKPIAATLEEYEELSVALSDSLDVLKEALRNNTELVGKNFKDFKVTPASKYDFKALEDALGAQEAKKYAKVTYTVDTNKFNNAVSAGKISQEVVKVVKVPDTTRISGGPSVPTVFSG